MSAPKQILVVTDLRTSAPAEIEPMIGIQRFIADHGAPWEIHCAKHCPLESLRGRPRFDGIIGRATSRVLQLATRSRIPMVNIRASVAPTRVPSVVADFEAAGRLAAECFLERGLRRAAFLGVPTRFAVRLQQGFVNCFEAAGGHCTTASTVWTYETTAASFDRFYRRVRDVVARVTPPVGILGFEDTACRYIAYACEDRGLRVPDDVAILGVTNNLLTCMQPSPSLSSIDCNFPMVGYRAAQMLAALMDGEPPSRIPVFVPPARIVHRRSTDHFFTGDPIVSEAVQFIAVRHGGRLRPRDVAMRVATSERTLQRRFRAAIGHSVVHEIIRQRVRRACRLLADSDVLLKQVAQECGFPDARSLRLAFLCVQGVSPSAYRRLHGDVTSPSCGRRPALPSSSPRRSGRPRSARPPAVVTHLPRATGTTDQPSATRRAPPSSSPRRGDRPRSVR